MCGSALDEDAVLPLHSAKAFVRAFQCIIGESAADIHREEVGDLSRKVGR